MVMRAALLGVLAMLIAPMAAGQCERLYVLDPNYNLGDELGRDVDVLGRDLATSASRDHPFQDAGAIYRYSRSDTSWALSRFRPLDSSTYGLGAALALGDGFVAGGRAFSLYVEAFDFEHNSAYQLTAPGITDASFFGVAMDASGADRLVVGADAGAGAAYVFYRDPASGAWTYIQRLVAADPRGGSFFGSAVSIDGDVITIGARQDDDQGSVSGSAYVFELLPDGTWIQTAKLLASDGAAHWQFGTSIAVSGTTVVVGAPPSWSAGPAAGSAYVFEKEQGTGEWRETQLLTESTPGNSHFFGMSVAVDRDLILVGAENAVYNGLQCGAAIVFHRQPNGYWQEVGTLGPDTNPQFNMEFGHRVALSGHTAVVGAYSYDAGQDNGFDAGAAYIFAVGPDADGNGLMDVCECIGDTNGDYVVSLADLSVQLAHYGTPGGATRAEGDFDADGDVDLADVASLLTHFGEECW